MIAESLFYVNALIALVATACAMFSRDTVHALMCFVLSLIFSAVALYSIGAPFAAAVQVIVYAGAIMVLFLFVALLLNVKRSTMNSRLSLIATGGLGGILALELFAVAMRSELKTSTLQIITVRDVSISLFTGYAVVLELCSLLLLGALVMAFHVGKKE